MNDTDSNDDLVEKIVDLVEEINPLMERHNALLAQLEGLFAAKIAASLGSRFDPNNPDCEGAAIMVIAQHRAQTKINNKMRKRGLLTTLRVHIPNDPRNN
jgi:hypothetical protein